MKKLILAEVAVLLVLVVVSIFVRIGISEDGTGDHTGGDPLSSSGPLDDQQAMATLPTETGPQIIPMVPLLDKPRLPSGEVAELSAINGFVYDLTNSRLIYTTGSVDIVVYPASVTKLFTAYVALQHLDPAAVVTAGEELSFVAEDSSGTYIMEGHQLSVEQLVAGMLLPSGNNAAYMLAVAAGRAVAEDPALDAQAALVSFVKAMNDSAQSLGMYGSHFTNPDGYHDDNHYTSSRDLITIARLALENPIISQYASTRFLDVTYVSGEQNHWSNTNYLLDPTSDYYCPDAVGLKTGYTDEAGHCLLSAFRVGEGYMIIGGFGCPESANRYNDTLALREVALGVLGE